MNGKKSASENGEKLYRYFIEGTYDLVQSVNPAGEFLFVNKSWEQTMGYTETDRATLKLFDIIHPDAQQHYREIFSKILEGESFESVEVTFIKKDGSLVILEGNLFPNINEGHIIGTNSFFHNITARKKTDLLLRGEKNVMEMIVVNKPLVEILETIALNYESYFNDAFCSILLLNEEGTHVKHSAGPSLPDAFNTGMDGEPIGAVAGSRGTAAYTKGSVLVSDIANNPGWIKHRDFALSFGLKSSWSAPIINENGKVYGTLVIYHKEIYTPSEEDLLVTERSVNLVKITLERIFQDDQKRLNEEKYRKLIDYAADGIFITDENGMYLDMNESACQISGYSKKEIAQLKIQDLVAEEESFTPFRFEELKAGKAVIQQRKLKRKDGTVVQVEINARQLPDGKLVAIVRDLTERFKAEAEKVHILEGLIESEKKYRTFIERVSDAFVSLDNEWRFTYINKKAGEISAIDPAKVLGKNIWQEFPQWVDTLFYKAFNAAKAEQRYVYLEEYHEANDVWIENHFYPSQEGVSVLFKNVTKRKKADIEKDKVKSETEALINSTTDMLWSIDNDYKLIAANKSFVEGLQLNGGYLIKPGDSIFGEGYFPEDYVQYWKGIYNKGLKGEKFIMEIFTPQANSAELLWFELKIEPIKKADTITGIVCSMRNITERKKTSDTLISSEEKYRTLVEQASDAIFIADKTGQLVTVNTSACKLAGLSEAELLQMRFHDFSILEDVQKNPFHFEELKAGRSVTTERIMKAKAGVIVNVEITAKLLTDGRLLAFVRDISERKRAEAAITQLNDELEQRVRDRTAELEAANAELEEINDLFVGREARIIELKDELAALKKKTVP